MPIHDMRALMIIDFQKYGARPVPLKAVTVKPVSVNNLLNVFFDQNFICPPCHIGLK